MIVPAFRSRSLAVRSAATLDAFLAARIPDAEVLLVDDGSPPAERPRQDEVPARTRVVQLPENRGKGAAVRAGMAAASGRCRVFTDVDLPYDLEALPHVRHLVLERGFHAAFGDRSLPDAEAQVTVTPVRRLASAAFTKVVGLFVVSGIGDTQCGLKAFSAPLADALFPLLTIDRFAFDVELYYVLLKHGVTIKRFPVRLLHQGVSSVLPTRDAAEMCAAILRLPLNHRLGRYASAALDAVERDRYWER